VSQKLRTSSPNPHLHPKPRPGRRERHRAEMRERIYRAALQLFAERGFLETTVEHITEAADVGKGTFFNYFPTKEHVLGCYGEERLQQIELSLERARGGKESVLDVLRDLATDLAGQSSESPDLLRSVFAANASCAPVRAELQKRIQRGRELLAEILAIGQERGEVRPDISAAELGHLIRLIFMGVTIAWAINPESSLRGTAERVWELLCPSLESQAVRGSGRAPESLAGGKRTSVKSRKLES
jgi:AcrR family transcriptional regulator